MPVFQNQDNKTFVVLPPGDYTFEVVGMESGIQTGTGKTAGSPFWELKLSIEKRDGAMVFERLIDHPTCNFKIDTFLKCTGAAPAHGVAFDFQQDAAESAGILWIDPVGLRGWCHLIEDEFTPKGATKPIKKNKVGSFLTDRPKLARVQKAEPVATPAPAADELPEDEIPF
jgi:hypothetical protein